MWNVSHVVTNLQKIITLLCSSSQHLCHYLVIVVYGRSSHCSAKVTQPVVWCSVISEWNSPSLVFTRLFEYCDSSWTFNEMFDFSQEERWWPFGVSGQTILFLLWPFVTQGLVYLLRKAQRRSRISSWGELMKTFNHSPTVIQWCKKFNFYMGEIHGKASSSLIVCSERRERRLWTYCRLGEKCIWLCCTR